MTEQAPQVRGAAAGASVETLLEALPYIREFHGRTVGDQVRRRGDARRGAARGPSPPTSSC